MAEAGGGQTRAFVKNLNRQTAQQIRESATATVKAMGEQVYSSTGGYHEFGRDLARRILLYCIQARLLINNKYVTRITSTVGEVIALYG